MQKSNRLRFRSKLLSTHRAHCKRLIQNDVTNMMCQQKMREKKTNQKLSHFFFSNTNFDFFFKMNFVLSPEIERKAIAFRQLARSIDVEQGATQSFEQIFFLFFSFETKRFQSNKSERSGFFLIWILDFCLNFFLLLCYTNCQKFRLEVWGEKNLLNG